ncbi:MAG: hypothetical protein ACLVJX_10115 [Merdibacter sp.]
MRRLRLCRLQRSADALVSGEMDTVLPPMQTERRQIADYLNSTPGPMGPAFT